MGLGRNGRGRATRGGIGGAPRCGFMIKTYEHTVTCDHFFTSQALAQDLLDDKTISQKLGTIQKA